MEKVTVEKFGNECHIIATDFVTGMSTLKVVAAFTGEPGTLDVSVLHWANPNAKPRLMMQVPFNSDTWEFCDFLASDTFDRCMLLGQLPAEFSTGVSAYSGRDLLTLTGVATLAAVEHLLKLARDMIGDNELWIDDEETQSND